MKRIYIILLLLTLLIILNACDSRKTPNIASQNTENSINSSTELSSSNVETQLPEDSTFKNAGENISDLENEGLVIFEDQSFWVELENWGKVRFISSEYPYGGTYKMRFYLVDNDGEILYEFPEFFGNQWSTVYEFKEASFKDVNKDGLLDLVVLADYMTGVGPSGADPFPVGGVYFQKDKEFLNLPDLDKQINDLKKNESIDMIEKFVESNEVTFK